MGKNFKKLVFFCFALCLIFLSSCGSTWTISGNSVDVSVCENDTVVPKGTIILQVQENFQDVEVDSIN